MSFNPLPMHVESEIHLLKSYDRLTIEAAIKGSKPAALQALTLHPLVKNGHNLKAILEEVLEANKQYLPQF
jgi:6-phospho-beta-glucosidase